MHHLFFKRVSHKYRQIKAGVAQQGEYATAGICQ
jgi:hypothetical protein